MHSYRWGKRFNWFWCVISRKQSIWIECPQFKIIVPLIESNRYCKMNGKLLERPFQPSLLPILEYVYRQPHSIQGNGSSLNSPRIHDYCVTTSYSKILCFLKKFVKAMHIWQHATLTIYNRRCYQLYSLHKGCHTIQLVYRE